jgi:hypothetical protein
VNSTDTELALTPSTPDLSVLVPPPLQACIRSFVRRNGEGPIRVDFWRLPPGHQGHVRAASTEGCAEQSMFAFACRQGSVATNDRSISAPRQQNQRRDAGT